jgi:hypothetical protein
MSLVCSKGLITEHQEHFPNMAVAGFVIDSASANWAAMEELDLDVAAHHIVNL